MFRLCMMVFPAPCPTLALLVDHALVAQRSDVSMELCGKKGAVGICWPIANFSHFLDPICWGKKYNPGAENLNQST